MAHLSSTPHKHTSQAHQSSTPLIHTSHPHLSYTPIIHTNHAHLTSTPHIHTSHPHLSCISTSRPHHLLTHHTSPDVLRSTRREIPSCRSPHPCLRTLRTTLRRCSRVSDLESDDMAPRIELNTPVFCCILMYSRVCSRCRDAESLRIGSSQGKDAGVDDVLQFKARARTSRLA